MPHGKRYSGHMPFGQGSGQCNSTLCYMARCIQGTCLLARAWGNAIVLHTLCHFACFVSRKCLSVQLPTPFTTRCRIILPTFACRKNVGSQGTISTKSPWWRRSSGSTTLLSAMLSQRSRLQRCRRWNHRVCSHLLRLIAQFAAWALGNQWGSAVHQINTSGGPILQGLLKILQSGSLLLHK